MHCLECVTSKLEIPGGYLSFRAPSQRASVCMIAEAFRACRDDAEPQNAQDAAELLPWRHHDHPPAAQQHAGQLNPPPLSHCPTLFRTYCYQTAIPIPHSSHHTSAAAPNVTCNALESPCCVSVHVCCVCVQMMVTCLSVLWRWAHVFSSPAAVVAAEPGDQAAVPRAEGSAAVSGFCSIRTI